MAKAKNSAIRVVADTTRAMPLDLAPLLKPHKRHGKLLLRVERMQRFARLSRGHNNGDGSWSLATDELEDLEYLVPEGTEAAHTLEVRIVAIEHGTTVATFEVPIAPEDFKAHHEGSPAGGADALTRQQRADFEALKISLAERDTELSNLRNLVEQSESELSGKIETAITLARDNWSAELEKLLTAANSQARADLERTREAWLSEQSARASTSELHAEKKIAEARETFRRETDGAIAEAEKSWKAAEAARFAKAEAEWRAATEKLAADLKAKCQRADAELAAARAEAHEVRKVEQNGQSHLRETLASARSELAKREQELIALHKTFGEAEVAWKAAENERNASTQAVWREAADKIAQELKVRCERAEKALAEVIARTDLEKKQSVTDLARQKEELATLRAAMINREKELADWQQAVQKTEEDHPRKLQSAIAAAREGWKKELERHLVQANAQFTSELEKRKAAWLADQNVVLAEAKKAGEAQLEAERERLSREAKETRMQAEETWKAAELARFAKAELAWSENAGKAEAALRARCERAEAAVAQAQSGGEVADSQIAAERARLQDDVAKSQIELVQRNAELAELNKTLLQIETELPAKLDAAVERARGSWESELNDRLSSVNALAAADLAEKRAIWLAAQDTLVAQTTKRFEAELEQAREAWRREAAEAHAEAEARWTEGEAARLAKLESQWHEKSDAALAALKAQYERALAASAESESSKKTTSTDRLIEELTAVRAQLVERDTELATTRASSGEALDRERERSDAAMAKAKEEWIDAELERLSDAESQWRKHSDELFAIAAARCEKAEAALAQLRAQPESERVGESEVVIGRLHDKIALMQRTLSERDRELALLRMSQEPSDSAQKPRITLQRDLRREAADTAMPARRAKPSGRLVRDVALVGAFAVATVIFWPQIESALPDSVLNIFGGSTDFDETADSVPQAKPAPVRPAPAPALPMASVIRSANVRSDPAITGDILGTVPRGAKVVLIGTRGNWTEVRIDSVDGKPQEGWIYNTYISTIAGDHGSASVR